MIMPASVSTHHPSPSANVVGSYLAEYLDWAIANDLYAEALLAYQALGLRSMGNRSANMTTLADEFQKPDSKKITERWQDNYIVAAISRFSEQVFSTPELRKQYPAVGQASSVKNARSLPNIEIDTYLLALLTNPMGSHPDTEISSRRRALRLWICIHDCHRLATYQYHGDTRISSVARALIISNTNTERWNFFDNFLDLAARIANKSASTFCNYNQAIYDAADQLLNSANLNHGKFEHDFLIRIRAISNYEASKPASLVLTSSLIITNPSLTQTILLNSLSYIDDTESVTYFDPQISPPTDPSPNDSLMDEDDEQVFVTINPDLSEAQKQLSANSIYLQSAEESSYLRWQWDQILPVEEAAWDQWLNQYLQSNQTVDVLGACMCWLATHTGRSLLMVTNFSIGDRTQDEWTFNPNNAELIKRVTRRQNSWKPKEHLKDLVAPYVDEWALLPTPISKQLCHIVSIAQSQPKSFLDLWNEFSTVGIQQWFNQSLPSELERLSSGKLKAVKALSIFEKSGDHNLSRVVTAHPNSGLPGSCAYSAWDKKALNHVLDIPFAPSQQQLPSNTLMAGSLLSQREERIKSDIADTISQLMQSVQSLDEYHNRISRYVVTALTAATGCRYLVDPFEQLAHFNLEHGFVYINDKSDDGYHNGRVTPLPAQITPLLNHYIEHLQWLSAYLEQTHPKLADAIMLLAEGKPSSMPLFFLLDDQLHWKSMNETSLRGSALFINKLAKNQFRHRYAQQLQRYGVNPEIIDSWMGHAERNAATYSDTSPRCWLTDRNENQQWADQSFESLGFLTDLSNITKPKDFILPSITESKDSSSKLFGERQRKKDRAIALKKAIRKAHFDIKVFIKDKQVSDLTSQEVKELMNLMLKGNGTAGNHFAALRFNLLKKYLIRANSEHLTLFKHYPVTNTTEPSIINDSIASAMSLLPIIDDWAHNVTVTKRTGSKIEASVIGTILLCIQKRICYERMLTDIMSCKNYRITKQGQKFYIEYNEKLEFDNYSAPVQRHEISYQIASLLSYALEGSNTKNSETFSSDELNNLKLRLALPEAALPTEILLHLCSIINQCNLLTLPGIVAAGLSGRIISCSLPIQDRIRILEKKLKSLPSAREDESNENTFDFQHLLTGKIQDQDGNSLHSNSLLFKSEIQQSIHGYESTSKESKRTAKCIEKICMDYEGKISTSILMVGYWIAHIIQKGQGKKKIHIPLERSTVQTYYSAIITPFIKLASTIDIFQLDDDEITQLYGDMIEYKLLNEKKIGFFGDRLQKFHAFAHKAGVVDPDWSELKLSDEHRRVRPGFITESDYLNSLKYIRSTYVEQEQWLFISFILLLCYRFGLRKNEAIHLLRKDWRHTNNQFWVIVRNNRYRTLKSAHSRRAIPLIGELSAIELDIVNTIMARYHSLAGSDQNELILCQPINGQLTLAPIANLIAPAIITTLRATTGNNDLVLHHARHAFHNRVACLLFNSDNPMPQVINKDTDIEDARRLILGNHHNVSRRSSMALARFMGHQSAVTGMVSYNHMIFEWADQLTPVKSATLSIKAIPDSDKWASYNPPSTLIPKHLAFEKASLIKTLQILRLVSQGTSYAEAGRSLNITPEYTQILEDAFFKANHKMFFNQRGIDRKFYGSEHPNTLLKFISSDGWIRMQSVAKQCENFEWPHEVNKPPIDQIPDLVSKNRQLFMTTDAHCILIKKILDLFSIPSEEYRVIAKKDDPDITELLTQHGFTVSKVKTSSSLKTALIVDSFDEHKNLKKVSTHHQYGALAINRNDKENIRNSNELAVIFLSMAVMSHHC